MSAGYMRRCAGKQRHDTKAQADDHGDRLAQDTGKRQDVYRCDQCLGWHVGGATKRYVTKMRRSGKRPNKRLRGRV